jgi:hypothetical protein
MPVEEVKFTTPNGLPLANGYKELIMTPKGPMVQFFDDQIVQENLVIPEPLLWRRRHPEAYYVEYRSRDYCGVRFYLQKREDGVFKPGFWYASAFDLSSDKYPILIDPLKRKKADLTIQGEQGSIDHD